MEILPNWFIYRKEEISLVKAVANKKGFGDKKGELSLVEGVVKKMMTDGGFVKLSGTGGLTRAGKALTDVWGRRIGNRFWDVLFNSLF